MNTNESANETVKIERINLASDWDRRVALASVRIGQVVIHGIAIWRNPHNGHLRVYLPRYSAAPYGYSDAVELQPELRSEIETEVLAAYREAIRTERKQASQSQRTKKPDPNANRPRNTGNADATAEQ